LRCLPPRGGGQVSRAADQDHRALPPGGGVDLTARLLMEPLSKELGQAIVVDNKGGAGGLIGVTAMAQSTPDGYTIAVTGVSSMSAGRTCAATSCRSTR